MQSSLLTVLKKDKRIQILRFLLSADSAEEGGVKGTFTLEQGKWLVEGKLKTLPM